MWMILWGSGFVGWRERRERRVWQGFRGRWRSPGRADRRAYSQPVIEAARAIRQRTPPASTVETCEPVGAGLDGHGCLDGMKRNLTAALLAVALLITGVSIPKLDGSSKEPAYLDIAFQPEN